MPELAALDVAADPATWRALGFTIDENDVCAVDGVAIRLGSAGRKISGWALAGVPGVQPGRRIATLRREAGAGIPLAFMSSGADSLAETESHEAQ